ncbi:hypothetical protein ACLMJK_006982 [Lecanora helva]
MPSIIQTAIVLEIFGNLVGIIALGCFPNQILRYFIASSLPGIELNGTVTFLSRSLSAFIFALTAPLLLAYPDSRSSAEKRKLAYWTLSTGEAILIPLLLWEAFRATDESKAAGVWAGGLSRHFCFAAVGNLAPILFWRVFVFVMKAHWFGDGESGAKEPKKEL